MTAERDDATFARLLDALGPYVDRVVIVGGWAHRLFRHHSRHPVALRAFAHRAPRPLDQPRRLRDRLPRRTQVRRNRDRLFTDVTDAIRHAVTMAPRRGLTPDGVLEVCREGLGRVLAGQSLTQRGI
jgi:hypothetical protein